MISSHLRSRIRAKRHALPESIRQLHAEQIFGHIVIHPLFQRSRRIAGFIASDGEQDPELIIDRAIHDGRKCFLPVLNRLHGNRLWFAPLYEDSMLMINQYGIPEPGLFPPKPVPVWTLDLVLTPLVAFDSRGSRVGMGGGYYDRTFSHPKHSNNRRRPFLLGVAHAFQEVKQLNRESWDIPLDGVVTENGVTIFK